jgi:dihydroneopterin aldolase
MMRLAVLLRTLNIKEEEYRRGNMLLELNGLEVDCVIGELPEERVRNQRLILDVQLDVCDDSAFSDELADTVDYAALADSIRAALVAAECRMIERAAKVAYDICIANSKVRSAKVRVTKSGAIKHLASASATFHGNKFVV